MPELPRDRSGASVWPWMLIAMAMIGSAAAAHQPLEALPLLVGGCAAAAIGVFGGVNVPVSPMKLGGVLGIGVAASSAVLPKARFVVVPGTHTLWLVLALSTMLVAVVGSQRRRILVTGLALVAILTSASLILIPNWEPSVSSDVYRAHLAAGRALEAGLNPYSNAVTFTSGDPFKPDDTVIVGYPYPPPSLATYASASIVTDGRVVSALAYIGCAIGLAYVGRRRSLAGQICLAVLLLLAAMPIWRLTLFMGWTEPLSIGLLFLGFFVGRHSKVGGWLIVAMSLASKQYFVLLGPLVALRSGPQGRRWGLLSVLVAGSIAAVPALFGLKSYVNSVLGNVLSVGFRPDSLSINGALNQLGVDLLIPAFVVVPLVLTLTYVARRQVQTSRFIGVCSLILALAFLFSSAFTNYWVLVSMGFGLAAIAAVSGDWRLDQRPASLGGA